MSTINLTSGAFITTWETTSSNESLFIPTTTSSVDYDFTIDWGDGTTETVAGPDPNPSHTYATAGFHNVKIYANPAFGKAFPQIFLDGSPILGSGDENNAQKLRSVKQWGSIEWQSMEKALAGAGAEIVAQDAPDLSNVTSMLQAFAYTNGDIEGLDGWDVSNVTNMSFAFYNGGNPRFIGSWNTSNVTDMSAMFSNNASDFSNTNIDNLDTSSVTDMSFMFDNASNFNKNINAWNTSSVTDMSGMFRDAEIFDQNLRFWDVSNVTTMNNMFGLNSRSSNNFSNENAAKTVAGWVDPDVNIGSNTEADMQNSVNLGMSENDYSTFSGFEVDTGGTPTTGQQAIDALCSDPPNWTIDMGGTEPTDCT